MQLELGIILLVLLGYHQAVITRDGDWTAAKCNSSNFSDGNVNSSARFAGGSVKMDLTFDNVESTAKTIVDVLSFVQFTFLCIISDRKGDPLVNAFLRHLDAPKVRAMLYTVDAHNTQNVTDSYVSTMKLRTDESLTIVLCGDPSNTLQTFKSLGVSLDKTKQTGIEHVTKWLTVSSNSRLEEIEKEISRLDNVVVVAPKEECYPRPPNGPELTVYTLRIEQWRRYLKEVGMTSGGHCQLELNDTLFPNLGGGFNGRHFTIGLYVWDPFTMRINDSNGIGYQGFCVDLVNELSVRLNFQYTLTEPADNNWGSLLDDGNWTGLVGMLQRFEIDISVAAMIITDERETVMDGTFPFYYDHVGVLYKRLNPEDSMWKTYFHPFKPEVFRWFAASVIFSCLVYLLLSFLSPSKSSIGVHSRVSSCLDGVSLAASEVDNVVSAVFQQGRPELPSHCPGQVFLAFWWLFLMILAAIYKGNLIAFLMVPQEDVPFTTLYDLATQDVYKWGVTGSTVVERLFQESKRPDFKLLGDGIEKFKATDKNINSLEPLVHLAKVRKGYYAYISDMVPMEIWMSEDCDLRLLEQTVIPLPFVVGLQNNSGFLRLFNEQLLHIDQIGLYSVWKQRWWPEMGRCGMDSRTAKKILSVQETQASFYILCVGIVVSILCLLLEHFMKTKLFLGISSSFHSFYVKTKNLFLICRRRS